ncbi:hypothetical protein K5X82_07180 [Halosquirtibacter xylanolyticus]|uniref:hypothetical protein n=1 Tax=Halosquirtibacter xylanolyticus TaxID=3374599 RepID=UPI0037486F16|nr:hypothetical protein K5X82_07180 [Prolixibacteraceae bacterium]
MDRELTTDKKRIQTCFKQGFRTYDQQATIQKRVAEKLVDCLAQQPLFIPTVFEIGAGSGILTESLLSKHMVGEYRLNDIVTHCFPKLAGITKSHAVTIAKDYMGDIEQIDLPQQNNLIISSSVFQWIQRLPTLLNKLSGTQNRGDILAFSIYTKGTYTEFHQTTGAGLNYLHFDEITTMVEQQYDILHASQEQHTLSFNTPKEVLLHMKRTGVNGVGISWNKSQHLHFMRNYPTVNHKYQLTYVPSYFILKRK